MRLLYYALSLAPLWTPGVLAQYLGPTYPPPRDLTSDSSRVATSWKKLDSALKASLSRRNASENSEISQLRDLTFSVGMFSTLDPAAQQLQIHHTSAEVANSSVGMKKVDGDSIYRIASVSKLITVFAGLLELDSADWEWPLTDVFPEMADFVREKSSNLQPVYDTQWDKITLNAIASQMGGIPRGGNSELLASYVTARALNSTDPSETDPTFLGLPPLNESDPSLWQACWGSNRPFCAEVPYAEAEADNSPVFLPWSSPQYANNGYMFLGMAIANLTGKPLEQVYQDSVFEPLGMTSSLSDPPAENDPNRARSVIAGPIEGFAIDASVTKGSGGLLSTTNDLAKLGVAILNSTLLPADQTRKWIKPVSHSADLRYSVGKPWEIYRYVHPDSGIVTDIYTKMGDSGNYGGLLAVLPDFDAGFSVLDASSLTTRSASAAYLMDLVINAVVPALIEQAALEAQRNYIGTYRSSNAGLNSSLTLALSPPTRASPGLIVSSWISNGTDITPYLAAILGGKDTRLVPTIPASGKVAFRPYTPTVEKAVGSPQRLISRLYDVNDLYLLDGSTYGGQSLSLLVFDVDENGRATAVTPPAFRTKLERQ
ncbi:beta-lactamase/transpeptidase-like protein [Aspergillus pseudonomiae]|uniref:Beta-lactamase/transpeptidase-like protein n=1 Tax=Aspergillus pseudonomiae TaxID=1506151 RepID=A0A5N7DKR6_9EURO|nr:beta-lactamase/transpeptidase-like protein [Aspergillus pseudonomiae]KAB8262339.1 beta-lactamase/transpeptidase-like protein [Aspergillus pseudonomiae]KAE8407051.1 beta-lactamase/transpeptidase-like protein [Aspergillus pseudonomiae]